MLEQMRPWIVVSSAWVTVSAISMINQVVQRRLTGGRIGKLPNIIFDNAHGLFFALMTPLIFAASRRWPFGGSNAVRRTFLHFGLAALVWLALAALYQGILSPLIHSRPGSQMPPACANWAWMC